MQQKLRMNPPYRMAESTLSGSSELPRLIKLAESSRFRNPNDSGGSGSGWNLLWEHRSLLVFYIFAILILLALWVAKKAPCCVPASDCGMVGRGPIGGLARYVGGSSDKL